MIRMRRNTAGAAMRIGATAAAITALLLLSNVPAASQTSQVRVQERHVTGQSIAPIFEGWAPNADGTFSLFFGYLNRNYEEEVDIPLGPNNMFDQGSPDAGQPTHFLPRRHKMAFAIVVPKDFGAKRGFTWTLTIRGNTEKVTGSLNPIWQVDVAKDTLTNNTPPVLAVSPDQTVTMPGAAAVTATVTDDGLPKPKKPRGGQKMEPPPPGVFADLNEGLTVEWSKYRGSGKVTFANPTQSVVNGKAATTATFSAPGEYVLQVVADDGSRIQGYHCCWTNALIKVTVKPATGSTGGQP